MLVLRPADAEAVSNLAGGDCGKDLKWSLDYSGNLKIRGDGPMDHYGFWDYEAPGWKDYSDQIKTLTFEKGATTIGRSAFDGCKNLKTVNLSLKTVTIKKGITKISNSAFKQCTSLTNVQLGEDLTFISGAAFAKCTALKEITIPDKVTELQGINYDYVFDGCTSLEKVTLGVGLEKVGRTAFKDCTSLKEIYFCGEAPKFDENETFAGCGTIKAYYPASSSTWGPSTLTAHGAQRIDWQTWNPPLTHFTPVLKGVETINSGVKVTWQKMNGATGYEVYRKSGNGTSAKAAAISGSSATSWTDRNVANGTRYTYSVYAINGSAKSKVSNSRYLYFLTTNTAKVSSKSGVLTVKWNKNSKATGYQIQYGTKASFSGASTASVNKTRVTQKTISLKKGKTYYVRVRSCKTVSGKTYCGAWSSAKKIKIK